MAPKLWRIPIPLPAIPGAEHLGFCNAYLIGPEPWLLVDTGMTTEESVAAFDAGMKEAGVPVEEIDSVLITHHHPDHYGMSRPIRERSGAKVMIHRRDVEMMYESLWGGDERGRRRDAEGAICPVHDRAGPTPSSARPARR